MTPYEAEKYLNKSELAVRYMISVWDEVRPGWRDKPDHVQQKFLEAEIEIQNKINSIDENS